jgi:hypothetical protein
MADSMQIPLLPPSTSRLPEQLTAGNAASVAADHACAAKS